MRSFKDRGSRTWDVDVNGDSIRRVQGDTRILLTSLFDRAVANALADDPVQILDILWSLCRVQAEERKVEQAEFFRSIGGDALDDATDALINEVIDFFPKARRPVAQQLMSKGRQIAELAATRAVTALQQTTAAELLEKSAGESSGSSPASSASSPAD